MDIIDAIVRQLEVIEVQRALDVLLVILALGRVLGA